MENNLQNELISSWVKLSGMIKNNRITTGLKYNEAIVMLNLYDRYLADGEGLTSIKDIIKETGMLKSLVNRTLGSLEQKGLIEYSVGTSDRRTKFVKCIKEKLDMFFEVHNSSSNIAQNIIEIIGEEDAERFVKIVEKLSKSGYRSY